MSFFRGKRVAACLRDTRGLFMQRDRVETDGTSHGLPVRKSAVRRHQCIGMFGRNFDKIAQHAIMFNLEGGNAGFFAISRLHGGNGAAGIARSFAQVIKRRVIPLRNISTI